MPDYEAQPTDDYDPLREMARWGDPIVEFAERGWEGMGRLWRGEIYDDVPATTTTGVSPLGGATGLGDTGDTGDTGALARLTDSTRGRGARTASGQPQAGYAHVTTHRDADGDARGGSMGAGLLNAHTSQSGVTLDAHVADANVHVGSYTTDDGRTTHGDAVDAQLLKIALGRDDGQLGGELGVATASGGATVDDTTIQAGLQANLIEGAVSSHRQDADSRADRGLRLGASVGAGAAGRVHYGDADEDGRAEYGYGFDAGPLSVDYRSETLMGDIATAPLAPLNFAMSAAGVGDYSPGAGAQWVIDKELDALGSAAGFVADLFGDD